MKIYVAYTGGTIGMVDSPQGYIPDPRFAETILASLQAYAPEHDYTVHCYETLIDSSNATPKDWEQIAHDLHSHWQAFDGFLVLHGTDTMAYTASALALMFQNPSKPIVITGSQIPMVKKRNDALANVYGAVDALLAISQRKIPSVYLFFGGKLLLGSRAKKVNTAALMAFDSPQVPAVAELGIEWQWHPAYSLTLSKGERGKDERGKGECIQIPSLEVGAVTLLPLFPGIQAEQLTGLLTPEVKGAVLLTYGAGNGPDKNQALLALLKQATNRGCVIVNVSQCGVGAVAADAYATGSALKLAGVISAYDMTYEAALVKLHFLIGLGLSSAEIKTVFSQTLANELGTK
ncbi:L-asparaginase 1 [Marinomonas agarivorans]|nr:L-asparaginase 1 [Marinomonas agarivorans]